MDKNARIVNVIALTIGEEITYFTLEGIEIGGFIGGKKVAPQNPQPAPVSPKGGVVTAQSPKELKREKERQADKNMSIEERLDYEKKTNA